jgi:hypothetical protein
MKTAVEWLHEQFKAGFNYNIEEGYEKRRDELFEEAKEMEKEQIIDAYVQGADDDYEFHINPHLMKAEDVDAQKYYNETFKPEQ